MGRLISYPRVDNTVYLSSFGFRARRGACASLSGAVQFELTCKALLGRGITPCHARQVRQPPAHLSHPALPTRTTCSLRRVKFT